MSAGSLRGVNINGVSFNVAADASISLTPRVEKESIPHSGGNMTKETLAAASATGAKLILRPSEFEILRGLAEDRDIPLSYMMADGSSFKTVGDAKLGEYITDDSSCEVEFLTSTGVWDIFAET